MKKHELKLWIRSLGASRYLAIAFPSLILPFSAFLIHRFFPPELVTPWIHMLFLTALPLFSIIPTLEIIDGLVNQSAIEYLHSFIRPGYRLRASMFIFGVFYIPGLVWMFVFSSISWVESWLILYFGPVSIWLFFHFYALSVISRQSRAGIYSLILYILANLVIGPDLPNFPMFFTYRAPSDTGLLSAHLLYMMSSILWIVFSEKRVPLGREKPDGCPF